MLRYLTHRQLDRAKWDALLHRAPNGLIYALTWYLDIVAPGWEAIVKEQDGEYQLVVPLPVRRKFGIRYLAAAPFAQQLGAFYTEPPTPAEWQQLGQLLRQRFWLIARYPFGVANAAAPGFEQLALGGQRQTTFYLPLGQPYAAVRAGYAPGRRWRLNQARRRALHCEPSTDIDQMVQIFAAHTAPAIYGIIGEDYEYRLLRALYAAARQRGLASLWQARARADAPVLAMLLLFEFNGQLIYIFNCSTPAGKEAGAITVLLDEALRANAGRPVVFDFEAPEVASIAHFYGSFGSVAQPFLAVSHNQLPWPLQQLKAARMALYRRLRPAAGRNQPG